MVEANGTRVASVNAQGHELSLLMSADVRPTVYSLFLANLLRVDASTRVAVDAGAGGGILAIVLAKLGVETVIGVERSAEACELFEVNARANHVEDQLRVVHADIAAFDSAPHVVDLVVSNPPSIPEGHGALPVFASGGGATGMGFVDQLASHLWRWVHPQGRAQVVLSSLIDPAGLFGAMADHGWGRACRGCLIVPVRAFYEDAYGRETLQALAASGRALSDSNGHGAIASEFVTVYDWSARNP